MQHTREPRNQSHIVRMPRWGAGPACTVLELQAIYRSMYNGDL
jgi:hypothetical protein